MACRRVHRQPEAPVGDTTAPDAVVLEPAGLGDTDRHREDVAQIARALRRETTW
jgi:hypothetical protein